VISSQKFLMIKYCLPLVFSLFAFPVFAADLSYYNNTGDDAAYALDSSTIRYGQTFTTDTTALTFEYIKILASRSGTPGTCDFYLYAVDGSHKPTGAALSTHSWNVNSESTSNTWITLDMPNYTMTASTEYAFYGRCTSGSSGNSLNLRGDTSDTYAGYLVYSTNSGSTWTADANQSLMFEVWTTTSGGGEIDSTATATPDEIAAIETGSIISFTLILIFITGIITVLWIQRYFLP